MIHLISYRGYRLIYLEPLGLDTWDILVPEPFCLTRRYHTDVHRFVNV